MPESFIFLQVNGLHPLKPHNHPSIYGGYAETGPVDSIMKESELFISEVHIDHHSRLFSDGF